MVTLGEKIKQIRITRGFTQQDIAEKMDLQRNTIAGWERGARVPSSDKLIEYAKIVGVTLDYFQDSAPDRTLNSLMGQLEAVFMDAGISATDKDKAYQDIMKIYLKSKDKE